jgi:hypothetical protein
MGFLDSYLNARARRTNPAYARQLELQEQAKYNAQAAQQERDWSLEDLQVGQQQLAQNMGTRPTEYFQSPTGQMAQNNDGTGIFGDKNDQMEAFYKQQGNRVKDIRGYGANLLSDTLTRKDAALKPSALMEKYGLVQDGLGGRKPTLDELDKYGVLGGGQEITQNTYGDKNRTIDEEIMYKDKLAFADDARERVIGYSAAGHSAGMKAGRIDIMLKLLDTVKTGKLADFQAAAKGWAKELGWDISDDDLANTLFMQTQLGDEVMARVAETKGAVSEREMALFEQFSASMGKSTEANRKILRFQKAKLNRDKKVASMIREMQKQGKSSMEMQDKIDAWVNKDENSLHKILEGIETDVEVTVREEELRNQLDQKFAANPALAERYKNMNSAQKAAVLSRIGK